MAPCRRTLRLSSIFILTLLISTTATPGSAVITFTDIGAPLAAVFEGGTEWGDVDLDGDLDLLLTGIGAGGHTTYLYKYASGTFTNSGITLPALEFSSIAWGDYDNDGDLDIFLMGRNDEEVEISCVLKNEGAFGFIDANVGLIGLVGGAGAWADTDNDGDLDLLITGQDSGVVPTTRLYRNDGEDIFTLVETGFVPLIASTAAWADLDNDGDMDLALAGCQMPGFIPTSRLYRNEDGGASWSLVANLPGTSYGSVGWADHDCDGDLDLLTTGFGAAGGSPAAHLFRNDLAGGFVEVAAGLMGLGNSAADWGDFDNDGDPDILMSGVDATWTRWTLLYANDGAGGFDEVSTSLLPMGEGTVKWGDYDGEGDLDIVQSGRGEYSMLYTVVSRSDGATRNTIPSVPAGLGATVQGDRVIFSWSPSTDGQTASACLTYNLRVGTSAGGSQIMSAMSKSNGRRSVADLGNTQENTSWAVDVRALQYYWTVQAIDGDFAGSPFAAEQTLPLAAVDGESDAGRPGISSIFPNPSAQSTAITVNLSVPEQVRIAIHDVSGRCVRVLRDEPMGSGAHAVMWDGRDDQGRSVGSGFYLCRLGAGPITSSRSILRIE